MPLIENKFHSFYNTAHAKVPKTIKFDFRYSFMFSSLIAPQMVTDFRTRQTPVSRLNSSKISIKRSYLMLTWLYYLTFTSNKKDKVKVIKFAFLPSTRKTYTLTKAPMAHKTFSKEQFAFKYYKFKVSIRAVFEEPFQLTSVDQASTSLLIAKNSFPVFETNMMFLKFYNIQMVSSAKEFYSYFMFTNSKISK